MNSFFKNKISLFIWTILFAIISLVVFGFFIVRGIKLSYPELSNQARQVRDDMNSIRLEIEQFGLNNGKWGEERFIKNYQGVNCDSSDIIKSACNDVKNITGKKPIIFTSSDKFCLFTEYQRGFYSKNDKYLCYDNNRDLLGTRTYVMCDEKEIACMNIPRPQKNLDNISIALILSFLISLSLFILFLVRLLFVAPVLGLLEILFLVIMVFVFYLLFLH